MGVESRRAPKPPTATDDSTDVGTAREEDVPTSGLSGEELGTDLSRRTDQTHWSVPEDGSPIDIPIPNKRGEKGRGTLTRGSSKSQTSLLIEYFEGGKGPGVESRPSVRVKVTPSAARKIKDTNERIRVSESKAVRSPSYTKRIQLGESSSLDHQSIEGVDDDSLSGSYTSAAEHSSLAHRHPPVEVEVMRGDGSDFSGASDRPIHQVASDVSSMPPDSMLDEPRETTASRQVDSSHESKVVSAGDNLKTPAIIRSRSVSKERLAQKAMEKLAARPRDVSSSSGKHKRSSKTRSRSISEENLEKHRRKSSRQHEEADSLKGADSTLSPPRQSGDQYSMRSGTSASSINANPRLLETVENAIRRLILPELETMRQEQRMQKSRRRFEQDSTVSASTASRSDDLSRKLSKHNSAPDMSGKPKVVLNRDEHSKGTILSGDSVKGRREHRRSRKSDSPSERSFERGMSEETVIRDGEKASRKKSKDGHRLRDAAAAGIAGGVLTAAALSHHDKEHSQSPSSKDRKERRRRRSKSHSRSTSVAETEEIFNKHDVPPMPMRSDVQSSDLTRDSILSERTEAPSSITDDIRVAEVQQVTRGSPREISASGTPTRSPRRGQGLSTHQSDNLRGDVSPQSHRSYNSLEEQNKSKLPGAAALGAAVGVGAGALAAHEVNRRDEEDDFEHDYRQANRGLSPIQSVSSRQESEINRESLRRIHSSDSAVSLKKQALGSRVSAKSLSSNENMKFDHSMRPKGMNLEPPEDVLDQHRLRELEADLPDKDATEEWLRQEHEKNDRYRDSMEEGSLKDSTIDYNRFTNYTDDSLDAPNIDKVATAQELQGVTAARNPDYRSTPVAVESAVASLHDPSVLSVRSKAGDKAYSDSQGDEPVRELATATGEAQEHQAPSQDRASASEEVLKRKTASPAAKESPRQSVARSVAESEQLQMGATGLPDANDPIPEIGYGAATESDISTNPSIIRGPMAGPQPTDTDHWPYQATPHQPTGMFSPHSQHSSAQESLKAAAKTFLGTAEVASRAQRSPSDKGTARDLDVQDEYDPRVANGFNVNHDFGSNKESYMKTQPIPSPARDEGYVSGPQRGPFSPTKAFRDAESWSDGGLPPADDPFIGAGHVRHLSTNSGLAHGSGTPLFDGATGEGLDRILSKDIVALMDHVSYCKRRLTGTGKLTLYSSLYVTLNGMHETRRYWSLL